jgi:hypothetical protein
MDPVSDYQNSDHTAMRSGGYGCLRDEVALGPFELVENSGEMIDVQRTFAPKPFWAVVFIKLILTGVCVDRIIRDLILYDDETRYFYFAYLTHWGLICSIIFMLLSTINTLMPYPEQQGRGTSASVLVKLAWAFFPLAATVEAVVVMLYWALDFQSGIPVSYATFMKHGGVFVIVLLEGLVVDRVPIRLYHVLFPMILALTYGIWSAVHGLLTDIGNPVDDVEDDAIYPALNWEVRPISSLVTALIALFLLTPFFFIIIYALSFPMRRYVSSDTMSGRSSESTTSTISTRSAWNDISRFRPKGRQNAGFQSV